MSIVPPTSPVIPSLRAFPWDNVPYTNVTPLTIRDNATMQWEMERVKEWIRDGLVPHVDSEFARLVQAWLDSATLLFETVNFMLGTQSSDINAALDEQRTAVNTALATQLATVTAQLAAQESAMSAQLADMTAQLTAQNNSIAAQLASQDAEVTQRLADNLAAINAAVDTVITDGIQLQDPVVAAIFGDSESEGRTITDALYEVVYLVDTYGAKGDWVGGVSGSGTNDTAAIQALINAVPEGATIRFTPGKTYRWDRLTATKSLIIDGAGANAVVRPGAADGITGSPSIWFTGASGTPRAINPTAVGDTAITLVTAGDAAEFSVGDKVVVRDSKPLTRWNSAEVSHVGRTEIKEIISIAGAVLNLSGGVEWAYDTTPVVARVTKMITSPQIKRFASIQEIDPGIWAPGSANSGPHIFAFSLCDRPLVEDVTVNSWNLHVVNFSRCLSPIASRLYGSFPYHPEEGGHGYLCRFEASHNGELRNSRGLSVRHLFDVSNAYDCVSSNNISENSLGAAFYTHGVWSKRTRSTDDSVYGFGGWVAGNPAFGPDYDFVITRPVYRGTYSAAEIQTDSIGMLIIEPDFETTAAVGVWAKTGASDLVIEGGAIKMMGPTVTNRAAVLAKSATSPGGASIAEGVVGNVTIRNTKLSGERAIVSVNSDGDVILDGLVFFSILPVSGIPLIGIGYTENTSIPRSLIIKGVRSVAGSAYQSGINIANAPTGQYEVTDNYLIHHSSGSNGGLNAPVGSRMVLIGNTFRTDAASIGLVGDVAAAKTAGARVYMNLPTTHNS